MACIAHPGRGHVAMRSVVGVVAALLAALLALVALVGCGADEREPIPVIDIVLLREPGVFLLNHKRLIGDDFEADLQALADKYRRTSVSNCRAFVRIHHSNVVGYQRVQAVIGLCARLGLEKVTVDQREGDLPSVEKKP